MPYKDKQKQNEYRKRRTVGRRKEYIKNKKCVLCGSNKNVEIDHINPKLKISHRIWDWSQSRINEELAKCQILCHNCHRQKTHLQNNTQAKHGSMGMYQKGCRCDLCKDSNVQRVRRQRLKSF